MALTDRSRVHLGPLTTSHSLPATCFTFMHECPSCTQAWAGQRCVRNANNPEDNSACWPPTKTTGVPPGTAPLLGFGFYSPGLACPTGYSTACSATADGVQEWPVQFRMEVGETAIGCCPTGFRCGNSFGNTCISTVVQATVALATCENGVSVGGRAAQVPITVPVTGTSAASIATISALTVLAPMFQLNWRQADLSLSSSTSSTTSSSTSGSSDTSAPAPAAGSGGLSAGAAAGIAVAVTLVVVALFLGAFFYIRRAKRRKAEITTNDLSNGGGGGHPGNAAGFYESDGKVVSEVHGSHGGYELAGSQNRWGSNGPVGELDGSGGWAGNGLGGGPSPHATPPISQSPGQVPTRKPVHV